VAPLHRAVALAQPDRVLVLVGHHLDLDVPRVLEELLHIDGRIAERRAGLRARRLHRVDQRGFGVHHAHAAPAAAARRLDDHRVAHAAADADDLLRVLRQLTLGARNAGHTGLDHGLLGGHLVAHHADRVGGRADESEAAAFDPLGKIGVLRQEAVTGVDGFSVGHLGGRDDRRHVEITLGRCGWPDANGFVSQLDVFGVAIGL
jgi:hypothetical protein